MSSCENCIGDQNRHDSRRPAGGRGGQRKETRKMGQWTLVEGTLADGLPMRLYVAVHNGNLWSASLQDDAHPRTEDEFAWRLGKGDKWVRCESGAGPELLASAAKQIVEYFSG